MLYASFDFVVLSQKELFLILASDNFSTSAKKYIDGLLCV